ncbi:MAG: hypothetical protein AAF599_07645, partial [Bacteroidota bacterium]
MKKITRLALFVLLLSPFGFLNAQIGINNDNSEPDASAILDVKSDSKGMLVPRMSSSQRTQISNAATGLLVFDTTTESFWFKDSNVWVELVSGNVSTLMDADGDTKIDVDEGGNDRDEVTIDLDGNESFKMTRGNINFLNSSSSIYVGNEAGKSDNFTGSSNIGIGANALSGNSTGSNNTAIGSSANVNASNLTNATAIGALASVDQSNALVLGNNADVGIGTSAPDEKLHVVGNIKMEDGNEQAGYVLTSDADGVGTWQAVESPIALADADDDTKIQVEEGSDDDDIIRFDLEGTEYFRMQQGRLNVVNNRGNVYMGSGAGSNYFSGTTSSNVGIGSSALAAMTGGGANVAVGAGSLQAATSENDNVAIGFRAGGSATGSSNIYLGRYAGRFASGSNRLYIDNTDTANPLIYGEFDNDLIRINGNLEVTGSFPGSDDQSLSFNTSNNNLSIEDGNVVDLSSIADDLGDHSATQNIQLNGNYLSNDGNNEGLIVENDGDVTTSHNLDVTGGITMDTDNAVPIGADRRIRMLTGYILPSGSSVNTSSTGFSVTKAATGVYQIDFNV